MTALYETLGVEPDASAADIKKAYRRAAMSHHPDRGGDDSQFKAMKAAYEVLSDPERRQRYDETGETDQSPSMQDMARAAAAGMIDEAVSKLDNAEDSLDFADPVQAVRDQLHHTLKMNAQTVKGIEKMIRSRETALKRLKRIKGEGDDLLSEALRSSIAGKRVNIEAAGRADDLIRAVLDILAEYDYELALGQKSEQRDQKDLPSLRMKAFAAHAFKNYGA